MKEKLIILNLLLFCSANACSNHSDSESPDSGDDQNQTVEPINNSNPGSNTNANSGNNSGGTTEGSSSGSDAIGTLGSGEESGVPEGYSSWAELNQLDPKEKNLFTFKGEDPVNALLGEDPLCEVYVLAHYRDKNGKEVFALKTSFSHNGDTHPYLLATIDATALSVTATDVDNKSQAFFKFAKTGDFLSSTAMNLKWFHINHYDTGVCENLKLVEKN